MRAVFDIDVEDAFEQARPTHTRRRVRRVMGCMPGCILRRPRHDRGTQLGVGGEHAVEADQMQAWAWRQRCEALHEFQRRHDDMRGAVVVGTLELQHDLAGAITLEPFVGNGGARDIAAQAFEFLALTGATALLEACRRQAVRIGAQCWRGGFAPTGDGLQAQHFLPRPRPKGDAIGA